MTWQELVVFSRLRSLRVLKDVSLSKEDSRNIEELVKYVFPKPTIPVCDEFTEVKADRVVEGCYDEVSPFPDMNRISFASRILCGGKIAQWSVLRLDQYPTYHPFKAYRGHDGVVVQFLDPQVSLKIVPVPHCRRDCFIPQFGKNQCAAYGSYSQMELRSFLPFWDDRCSAESARTCPMRLSKIEGKLPWPQPTLNDPVISQFQEWCKTRKGWTG